MKPQNQKNKKRTWMIGTCRHYVGLTTFGDIDQDDEVIVTTLKRACNNEMPYTGSRNRTR